jgi:polyketide cyclase/dehydrase/lipid transport protein
VKQNSKEADVPQIVTSTVVATPVGEVWALLRDFAAIGDWHPALPACEIQDRTGREIAVPASPRVVPAAVQALAVLHGDLAERCQGGGLERVPQIMPLALGTGAALRCERAGCGARGTPGAHPRRTGGARSHVDLAATWFGRAGE